MTAFAAKCGLVDSALEAAIPASSVVCCLSPAMVEPLGYTLISDRLPEGTEQAAALARIGEFAYHTVWRKGRHIPCIDGPVRHEIAIRDFTLEQGIGDANRE